MADPLDLHYAMGEGSPLERPVEPSMAAYDPTIRDRIARTIAGDTREQNLKRGHLAEALTGSRGVGTTGAGLIDVTPAGLPLAAEEIGRTAAAGHPGEAAVQASLMTVPGARGAKALARTVAPTLQTTGRGILSTNLREMSLANAINVARSERHLMKTGAREAYVGAPNWVTDRTSLERMRADFDAQVVAGAVGGQWYPLGRAGNIRLAGPRPMRQRLLAREEALWSAQANPDANLGFALRAHNAYEAGVPETRSRTGQQARTYLAARETDKDIRLGEKTGVYGAHLDPTHAEPVTGTNDIWHARAFGYVDQHGNPWGTKGSVAQLSPQQHSFLDHETLLAVDRANQRKLGGRSDWTAGEVQAAAWVAKKGEGLAEQAFKRDQAKGIATLADWERYRQAGVAEAAKGYPDYFSKYTAHGTYEQTPYSQGGHLPGVQQAPYAERERFAQERRWTDRNNRDVIYDALGMYQQPTSKAHGVYTPPGGVQETNPARVANPMVGFAGPVGERQIDPHSRAMIEAAEAARGYVDVQGAAAYSMPVSGKVATSGSVLLPRAGNRPLTMKQMEEQQRRGGALGVPDVIDYGTSSVLTNFSSPLAKKENLALAKRVRAGEAGPGAETVRLDSGYLPLFEKVGERQGTGEVTRALQAYLTHPDAPAVLAKLDADPAIRQRVLDRIAQDAEYGTKTGQPVREDVQRARDIIAREGFTGLFAALKAGVALPVGLLALLGLPALAPQGRGSAAETRPGA